MINRGNKGNIKAHLSVDHGKNHRLRTLCSRTTSDKIKIKKNLLQKTIIAHQHAATNTVYIESDNMVHESISLV